MVVVVLRVALLVLLELVLLLVFVLVVVLSFLLSLVLVPSTGCNRIRSRGLRVQRKGAGNGHIQGNSSWNQEEGVQGEVSLIFVKGF